MALVQIPRPAGIPQDSLNSLPTFRLKSEVLKEGRYKIKSPKAEFNSSDSDVIRSKVWFKSPALDPVTIRRLDSIQLYAESHDQSFCDNEAGGNWTWFELGIYEDEGAELPRKKDGIELVWRSHYNAFMKEDFEWCEGDKFDETHDLVRFLEDGNVIGVRLCSRFPGWEIHAQNGYLIFDVGQETLDRAPPPAYGAVVSEIKTIADTINEVNLQTGVSHKPFFSKALLSADALSAGDKPPLRVLSLDGGGVRGLLTLHLLKAVMDKAAPNKKPYEVFHMIAGTSTGGLIAIMLGRLQMSIDECIKDYEVVMKKVFPAGTWKKWNFITGGEFYDEKPLENAIREIVNRKLKDPEAVLLEKDESNPCKIFVTAVRKDAGNNRSPVFLRSYKPNYTALDKNDILELLPEIKVWEAARATSAAPAYFKPFAIKKYELLDGGLGANNPLGWLWTEVLRQFGSARSTSCFLSIGTGIPPNQNLPRPSQLLKVGETLEGLSAIATNTEIIHILFRTLIDAFAPKPGGSKYWRLNIGTMVDDNYAKIGDLDDVKALAALLEVTKKYIADNAAMIAQCADALKSSLNG